MIMILLIMIDWLIGWLNGWLVDWLIGDDKRPFYGSEEFMYIEIIYNR